LEPGQRRRFEVPEASLAAAIDDESGTPEGTRASEEPINFEVTYVYAIDEFPRRGRAPSEPVTAQLMAERLPFTQAPRCAVGALSTAN
jgi:hypothetical protein